MSKVSCNVTLFFFLAACQFGLIPQKSRSSFPPLLKDKKSWSDAEELTAVWRVLFYHKCLVPPRPFYTLLLLHIFNTMQMYPRGVGFFVDLLDVVSVSQGLMLSRYLRVEYLVMNVNSQCLSTVEECMSGGGGGRGSQIQLEAVASATYTTVCNDPVFMEKHELKSTGVVH